MLDRAYDDRLERHISDDLWSRKSAELEDQLQRVRADLSRTDRAVPRYAVTGREILELTQRAPALYVTQNPAEQARLLKTLLSNCAFDRGSLTPTYNKPFDIFVDGTESGNWLLSLDSVPLAPSASEVRRDRRDGLWSPTR